LVKTKAQLCAGAKRRNLSTNPSSSALLSIRRTRDLFSFINGLLMLETILSCLSALRCF